MQDGHAAGSRLGRAVHGAGGRREPQQAHAAGGPRSPLVRQGLGHRRRLVGQGAGLGGPARPGRRGLPQGRPGGLAPGPGVQQVFHAVAVAVEGGGEDRRGIVRGRRVTRGRRPDRGRHRQDEGEADADRQGRPTGGAGARDRAIFGMTAGRKPGAVCAGRGHGGLLRNTCRRSQSPSPAGDDRRRPRDATARPGLRSFAGRACRGAGVACAGARRDRMKLRSRRDPRNTVRSERAREVPQPAAAAVASMLDGHHVAPAARGRRAGMLGQPAAGQAPQEGLLTAAHPGLGPVQGADAPGLDLHEHHQPVAVPSPGPARPPAGASAGPAPGSRMRRGRRRPAPRRPRPGRAAHPWRRPVREEVVADSPGRNGPDRQKRRPWSSSTRGL